jgi:DNA polymerase-3 subunit epsilon
VTWTDGPALAFDLETTGTDPAEALPVSFALVDIAARKVTKVRHGLVNPGIPIPPETTKIHNITDIDVCERGGPLKASVFGIFDRLCQASGDGVPVVGANVRYDLTVIDCCHWRLTGKGLRDEGWNGPVVDTLVLDRHVDKYRRGSRRLVDTAKHYGVALGNAHAAHADAVAAAFVALAIAARYPEVGNAELDELMVMQAAWYAQWWTSYQDYRKKKGQPPMPASDKGWPLPIETEDAHAGY